MNYAVQCPRHGQVRLTDEEYDAQMMRPDSHWRCPRCGADSVFDDDVYDDGDGDGDGFGDATNTEPVAAAGEYPVHAISPRDIVVGCTALLLHEIARGK